VLKEKFYAIEPVIYDNHCFWRQLVITKYTIVLALIT
jgi:hypothetical protein